jgi:hypothetical protein
VEIGAGCVGWVGWVSALNGETRVWDFGFHFHSYFGFAFFGSGVRLGSVLCCDTSIRCRLLLRGASYLRSV